VVAPEHPPCRADDALERLDRLSDRGLAALMAAALSAIARSVTAAMSASRVGKWAYSVARATPARRAIAPMLASWSPASSSTAASRMRATLRCASARRGCGAPTGVERAGMLSAC
jgi:hypothetical protein